MIIDCHCHAGEGDGLTGPWDTRASLKDFMRWSEEAGITRTVLFPAFHTDYLFANRAVARIVARHTGRFFGFAFVHPERDRGRVLELVREAARAYRLPVLYDVMGEVSVCELLATEYPDVPFIIPHLGSFADDWKAQQAFIDPLTRYANIFTDTSGVRRFDLLWQAVRRAGAGKILFGSDGPWLHPGVELAKVRALKLSPRDEALVLGGNCLRLLRRVRRQAPAAVPVRARAAPMEGEFRDPWTARRVG